MNQQERVNGARMSLELPHERIGETRFAYASTLQAGTPGPEWQELQARLANCDECRSELEELRDILRDTYSGVLELLPPAFEPDLSFLQPSAPGIIESAQSAARSAIERAGDLIIQFTQSLVDADTATPSDAR
jgi:hypothetical protein